MSKLAADCGARVGSNPHRICAPERILKHTMPRGSASSNRSNGSDGDMEVLAESELAKLQHQFRIMEGDRQAYTLESQELLRKQVAEIEKLKKDREELMLNLGLLENKQYRQQDQEDVESIQNSLSNQEKLEEQIANEKQTIKGLEAEIKVLEQKILEQKKGLSKGINVKAMNEHLKKSIGIMENRLDRALRKFNTQLMKNGQLREQIDTLRVERRRFEQLHRKLEKDLLETRKEIGSVIDTSTAAYDARDEAQTKMLQLKEKGEKDMSLHTAEMKELQRVIDHDKKLKEFMGIKAQEHPSEHEALHGTYKQEQDDPARKRKDPKEETIEMYEAVFQQIRALTGEDNLDAMVTMFVEVEDRNFALFNYVNEQNSKIEKLQEEIAEIQLQTEAFKSQEMQLEEDCKRVLKKTETQQEEVSKQCELYESRLTAGKKILDQLKTGIESLFNQINCDRSILDEMLGSSSGIRDNNVMQYLGLIEQRTNELLSIQSYLSSKDYDKPYDPRKTAMLLLGQSLEKPTQPVYIEPPTTGNDDSDADSSVTDEERPLTQNELRQRIMKGVMKKEARALKKSIQFDRSLQKS
ncbi:coiled-coil domain-containing protein 114 isoform X1 [Hypanus sabinus]|uniref:coiled-coil domain-containing protein 114 isoform X1 n=2 Tax=Hypanus sabinus TaxID=79690 RepID=UPI0028C4AFCB|nr:coiled-coil domain-containing protein 114 isoform X1 [Hypanus sabinus]